MSLLLTANQSVCGIPLSPLRVKSKLPARPARSCMIFSAWPTSLISVPTSLSCLLHFSHFGLFVVSHIPPSTLLPQGLCTCCSLWVECFPEIPSWFTASLHSGPCSHVTPSEMPPMTPLAKAASPSLSFVTSCFFLSPSSYQSEMISSICPCVYCLFPC